jgi:hypothetical protein
MKRLHQQEFIKMLLRRGYTQKDARIVLRMLKADEEIDGEMDHLINSYYTFAVHWIRKRAMKAFIYCVLILVFTYLLVTISVKDIISFVFLIFGVFRSLTKNSLKTIKIH